MGARTVLVMLVAVGLLGAIPVVVDASDHGGCLYVYTEDRNGDDAETAVFVSAGDYSQQYFTLERGDVDHCDGVRADNGVSFATPAGAVRVFVFGGPDHNYQWGVFETTVPDGGQHYVAFERGGVFATGVAARPGADARTYAPGGLAELEFDLYNGQDVSGADVTVEVYVYPAGESRPPAPTAAVVVANLAANSPATVSLTAELPNETGRFHVDALLKTTFAIVDDYRRLTDAVAVDTIELRADDIPPEFRSVEPEPGSRYLAADETVTFEVAVADDSTADDVSLDWYLDGQHVDTGPTFELDAAAYGPGAYRLEVVASTGDDAAETATARWELQIIGSLGVLDVRLNGSAFDLAEPVELGAEERAVFEAVLPESTVPQDAVDYRWAVDGHEVATGQRFVFNASRYVYGRHRVRVTATPQVDTDETAAAEWTVGVASIPEIRDITPSEPRVTHRSGEPITFGASAVDGRGEALTYEWFVDGTPVGTGPELTHRFTRSGRYTVALRVSNEAGMTTDREWAIVVERFGTTPAAEVRAASRGFAIALANPDANDRAAVFGLNLTVPDEVAVTSPQGLEQRGPGAYGKVLELAPGEDAEVVVEVAADTTLAGQQVPVEYEVRAAPGPAPGDGTTLVNGSLDLQVVAATPSSDSGILGFDGPFATDVGILFLVSVLLALHLTYHRVLA